MAILARISANRHKKKGNNYFRPEIGNNPKAPLFIFKEGWIPLLQRETG